MMRAKCFAIAALVLMAASMENRLSGQENSSQRPVAIESPAVDAERKVSFRLRAPNAEKVRLTGGDMPQIGGGVDLSKGENDIWEITLGPVDPGAYRYRFDIDGVATVDPVNPATSESNTNVWSLVHIPGADWVDAKGVPHGAVAEVFYDSKSLGSTRRMHVYTPPNYEPDTSKMIFTLPSFPVLYLLHGSSDSDDAWTTVGRAGFILDSLIASGEAQPMIVVMPAGHTRRGPGGRGTGIGDEFAQDFLQDIMPYVETHYRVKEGRENRAIAGLSMGGGQTLNIAMLEPESFAYVGVFSSGVFGRGGSNSTDAGPSWEEVHKDVLENDQTKQGLKLMWFATGKDDFLVERSRATVEMLKKHNFDVVYRETEGAHTWIKWRDYLREFAPQLFKN